VSASEQDQRGFGFAQFPERTLKSFGATTKNAFQCPLVPRSGMSPPGDFPQFRKLERRPAATTAHYATEFFRDNVDQSFARH
jgi:hypothetical protein